MKIKVKNCQIKKKLKYLVIHPKCRLIVFFLLGLRCKSNMTSFIFQFVLTSILCYYGPMFIVIILSRDTVFWRQPGDYLNIGRNPSIPEHLASLIQKQNSAGFSKFCTIFPKHTPVFIHSDRQAQALCLQLSAPVLYLPYNHQVICKKIMSLKNGATVSVYCQLATDACTMNQTGY